MRLLSGSANLLACLGSDEALSIIVSCPGFIVFLADFGDDVPNCTINNNSKQQGMKANNTHIQ